MGFISGADKLQAAQQIKQWFDNANITIDRAKVLKESIVTQLAAMKLNTVDYSLSDVAEVESLLSDLNKKIAAI